MPTLLLLRHGHAGSKAQWLGNDAQRPLSRRGEVEANGLVAILSPFGVTSIASSPYLRCVQTVAPLARRLGLEVEKIDQLSPGSRGRALKWLREAVVDDVLLTCSHGEVIGPVLAGLHDEDGVELGPRPTWEKGSTWFLSRHGRVFDSATFLRAQGFP